MSTAPQEIDPKAAEPLTQVETNDPDAGGGTSVESAPAGEGETPKTGEGKAKPRLPDGVLKELAEGREAKRTLRVLLTQHEQKPTEPAKAAEQELKEPNPADYDGSDGKTTADYIRDLRAYDRQEMRKEMRTEMERAEKERETRTEAEIEAEDWAERQDAFAKDKPDYEEVTQAAFQVLADAKGSSVAALANMLRDPEVGPQTMYYFGQHPEELRKLTEMVPRRAVLALGAIVERLAPENQGGEGSEKPKPPPPPAPVKKVTPAAKPFNPTDPATYGGDFRTYKQKMDEMAAKKK